GAERAEIRSEPAGGDASLVYTLSVLTDPDHRVVRQQSLHRGADRGAYEIEHGRVGIEPSVERLRGVLGRNDLADVEPAGHLRQGRGLRRSRILHVLRELPVESLRRTLSELDLDLPELVRRALAVRGGHVVVVDLGDLRAAGVVQD